MKTIISEYWKILKLKKWGFFSLIFLLIITNLTEILGPLFYKDIANLLAGDFSEIYEEQIFSALFSILIIYIVGWIAWRIYEYIVLDVEIGGMKILSKNIFEILQKQKYEFFQNEFSGSIVKKSSRFVSGFESAVDWFMFQGVANLSIITGACIIFYFHQPLFSLYFGLFIILFLSISSFFSFWHFKYASESAEMDSKISGFFSDSFSNIFTVKSSGKEKQEKTLQEKILEIWEEKTRKAWLIMFLGFGVQAILWIGFEIFFTYLMIVKWREGNFTVGEFVLFQTISFFILQRLWEFGRSLRSLFTALADAKEMAEIIAKDDTEKDDKNAENFTITKGEIEFCDVDFGYDIFPEKNTNSVGASIHRAHQELVINSDKNKDCGRDKSTPLQDKNSQKNFLFNKFNLKINAGERVALVGESGSGKTTITKLLFRFYEIFSGKILFDNKNSTEILLHSLRAQISLVPQRPELFHRSIKENLLFAKPNATDAEISDALQKARAFDFVENLSEKINTMVGERGVKLSGGEAQRIAIARAFLEDAPIVVLDEATSALDSVTEQEIQEGIFELMKNKTAIVIAHRLSTILKMDRIIVMENGKILEEGSHDELIKISGKYAKMWKHQSGGFLGE